MDQEFAQSKTGLGSLDGLKSAAQMFRTPCGAGELVWRRWGEGRPVILLHGGSGSWTHWIKTIPALSQHYEAWAPDLPGMGDSAMPPEPLVPETCGRVVADGVRRLFAPERKPHLVAFSFGAHVGTFAAIELGSLLSGFTISGCAALGLPQGPGLDFAKERSSMSEAERRAVHRYNLEILMIAEPSRIDELAVSLQADNVRRARFRSRPFACTDEIRRNLARVTVPLSAIWGEKDQTAWPSVSARLDVLREHHPELVAHVIPDAGHWAMYEQPDAFNLGLLELLSARSG